MGKVDDAREKRLTVGTKSLSSKRGGLQCTRGGTGRVWLIHCQEKTSEDVHTDIADRLGGGWT